MKFHLIKKELYWYSRLYGRLMNYVPHYQPRMAGKVDTFYFSYKKV